jgi:WD40 repeat protein
MPDNIFFCYRRDDSGFATRAIYLRLVQDFPKDSLFMDVEDRINPGDEFYAILDEKVALCDVLLAIVGEGWIGATDEDGVCRLEKEEDFVRIEIESALTRGKRIIPVLVDKARMPRADELPAPLKPLVRRNAVRIRHESFEADSQGLVNYLIEFLELAEAERRQRAVDEEARAAKLAKAVPEQVRVTLTPEQIRKEEELANWRFIEDSTLPEEFRDHITRFSGGTTERYAFKKLEALLWDQASREIPEDSTEDRIERLRKFLDEFPPGGKFPAEHAAQATARLAALEQQRQEEKQAEERERAETEAWVRVSGSTDIPELEAFLRDWPDGVHAADARTRIETEVWLRVAASTDVAVLQAYQRKWPNSAHDADARKRIWELRRAAVTRRVATKNVGLAIGALVTVVAGGGLYVLTRRPVPEDRLRLFPASVLAVAFSPDGRRALSGSNDAMLELWEAPSEGPDITLRLAGGEESGFKVRSFTGHTAPVLSVAFSPDGAHALSGSWDRTLKLWDITGGNELRSFAGHTAPVLSVAFSPDASLALSGSADNTVKLWDVKSGREVHSFTGHSDRVGSVAFSPDGAYALSGSHDTTMRLWGVMDRLLKHVFRGHGGFIFSVAFSPDGARALSGSDDSTMKLWETGSGLVQRTFAGHTDSVTSVAFSPDGVHALSGSNDKTLKLWDVASGREVKSFGHTQPVSSVAFSPDGTRALSGSYDETLKLWNLPP